MRKFNEKLASLLRENGYTPLVDRNSIVLKTRGVMDNSERILPYRFKSMFNACDHLIPIIGEKFHQDFQSICKSE